MYPYTKRNTILLALHILGLLNIPAETSSFQLRPRYLRQTTTICVFSQPRGGEPSDGDSSAPAKSKTWNPLRLAVLRLGLTEPMGTSPLNYGKYNGQFNCAYCGETLFDSQSKYDSGSGWPSFWRSASEGAIAYERDFGRLECKCKQCNSHLGHVFLDGPKPNSVEQDVLLGRPEADPRGSSDKSPLPRFCINGAALTFEERSSST